jgi:tetratricopeptide (TPR) repeat protein
MTSRLAAFAIVSVLLAPTAGFAQRPDPALTAEAETRWDDAIRLHREVIATAPRRADLWIRIADIEARRGNMSQCIAALQKAADAAPGTPDIYFRLSQAYSVAGQPIAALKAIEGALVIEPESKEYLRARAVLSTWLADYKRAQASYRQLAALEPDQPATVLAFARASAWAGDTDEAVTQYERYLNVHAEDEDAWIELARAESWRGNYGAAVQALDTYRSRFGETAVYVRTYAAVMAGAGRPTRARAMVEPLLAQTPSNLELNLTRTIALAMQRRTREAFSSLETVRELAPASRDTQNAERIVRTMLASTVEPGFSVYSDSDHLQLARFAPHGTVALTTGTQLSVGYDRTRLSARRGSGLELPDGSTAIDFEHSWVGVAQTLGRLTLAGQGGYATSVAQEFATYSAGATVRPADSFELSFQRSSGAVVISPRTVGLGLTQIGHRAQIQWAPTLQSMVVVDAQVQDLSDGNRRVELTASPRRSFARTAGSNLDLGVSVYLLSTSYDFDHGYYDPKRYEHYAFTAFPYFKISENIGLSLSTALGMQRDYARVPNFRFGGTVSGEATFGIYEPWVLKVTGSASINRSLDSGAFRGLNTGVVLIRRF